jgi:hypothetical protein
MVPLLRGEATQWYNESVSQMGREHVMIKQDDLKYQYYGRDIPEVLFDLEREPGEITNVAARSDYAAAMSRFRAPRPVGTRSTCWRAVQERRIRPSWLLFGHRVHRAHRG